MTRRRFFKLSLFSALALSGVLVAGRYLGALGGDVSYPQRLLGEGGPAGVSGRGGQAQGDLVRVLSPELGGARSLSPKQLVVLQAAALRILDGAEPSPRLDGAARQLAFIDGYLLNLAPELRSDVRALIELLEYFPLVRYGTRFTRLSPERQDRVLAGWQHSRLSLLRQGFAALKSMCCLAHYQDERSFQAIGYSGPVI